MTLPPESSAALRSVLTQSSLVLTSVARAIQHTLSWSWDNAEFTNVHRSVNEPAVPRAANLSLPKRLRTAYVSFVANFFLVRLRNLTHKMKVISSCDPISPQARRQKYLAVPGNKKAQVISCSALGQRSPLSRHCVIHVVFITSIDRSETRGDRPPVCVDESGARETSQTGCRHPAPSCAASQLMPPNSATSLGRQRHIGLALFTVCKLFTECKSVVFFRGLPARVCPVGSPLEGQPLPDAPLGERFVLASGDWGGQKAMAKSVI